MQHNDTLIIYEGDYYEQAHVTNKDVVLDISNCFTHF